MTPYLIGVAVIFGLLLLLKACIWFEDKFLNKSKGIELLDISTPIPTLSNSPYKKKHFHLVDDVLEPKDSTVRSLMNHIELEFEGMPYVNGVLTHIIVPVRWQSKIEQHYDGRWKDGKTMMKGDINFKMREFDGFDLRSADFVDKIQTHGMEYLWNYYYECYPEIFQYPILNIPETD